MPATPTAASVPGIFTLRSVPPWLLSTAASLPTAAFERAGFFEAITIAAFSSRRLPPLAKTPAAPIQLAKARRARALLAPSTSSGASIAPSSDFTLRVLALGGASTPGLVPEVPSAASAPSPLTSALRLVPRWPRPSANHDSAGSSPNAWAASGSLDINPPEPGPEARVSASIASDPALVSSDRFACRPPVSRPRRPPVPCWGPLLEALEGLA